MECQSRPTPTSTAYKAFGAEAIRQILCVCAGLRIRGRGRLIGTWLRWSDKKGIRNRRLPGGAIIQCDLAIPYESMVWICCEEEKDLRMLRKLLKPGDFFIDCGANIGIWTLAAATRVGRDGGVYAYEPNPYCIDKLESAIEQNRLPNIHLIKRAVSASSTEELFLVSAKEHNLGRTTTAEAKGALKVQSVSIDETIPETVHVAGIKLDIEGFELSALAGAERTISTSYPWICVEFNPWLSGVNRLGDWPVHPYLKKLGYEATLTGHMAGKTFLTDDFRTREYRNILYVHSLTNCAGRGTHK